MELGLKTLLILTLSAVAFGAILFIPAGTLNYWQA
jgi:hypothetical protein